MISITINFNDVDKRLDNFLAKYFPTFTKPLIYKLIRTNKVKVNGKRKEFNYQLRLHDVINVYQELNEDKQPLSKDFNRSTNKLNIIYEDDNILVIIKPIGIPSQPDKNGDSIQDMITKYLFDTKQYIPEKENIFIPSICHRLDRNTSGIMVAAKNAIALKEMNEIFKDNKISKIYQCLVYGKMDKKNNTLRAYHYKNVDKNIVYVDKEQKPHYKSMVTEYKVIKENSKYSWLEINLITGRTHQIRAHMNFVNHPLLGEKKYITKYFDIDQRFKTQALVCSEIKFHSIEGPLSYLNNKVFKYDKIWFKELFNG